MDKSFLIKQFEEDLIFNFNQGLFKVNTDLIGIISLDDSDNITLLDLNNDPILIENVQLFKRVMSDTYNKAIARYQKLLLESE